MKKIGNLVASGGKYNKNGQEKTRWLNCGALFVRDDGSMTAKLESLPLGKDFEGWLNVFEDKPKTNQEPPSEDVPF